MQQLIKRGNHLQGISNHNLSGYLVPETSNAEHVRHVILKYNMPQH